MWPPLKCGSVDGAVHVLFLANCEAGSKMMKIKKVFVVYIASLLSLNSHVSVAVGDDGVEYGVTVDALVTQHDANFTYKLAGMDGGLLDRALLENKGKLLLPKPKGDGFWRSEITSIDSSTSPMGGVVYSGTLYDAELPGEVGTFTYAHDKSSLPYIYVSSIHGDYEILASFGQRSEDLYMKQALVSIVPGTIDAEPEETKIKSYLPEALVKSESRSLQNEEMVRGQCNVSVAVGYTNNAVTRNGSIVSSITAWLSQLNAMISEIGVTCNYTLAGTKLISSLTESNHIFTDYNNVIANTEIDNWKNNVVNGDIFVLITSNLEPHTDAYHGVAGQSGQAACATTYKPNAKCGQYAVVRDDYAASIRVFAHEILHLAGVDHAYAYGFAGVTSYGGNGFSSQNNSSERYVTNGGIRSTTVMNNPEQNSMCGGSSIVLNMPYCGARLPFLASQTKLRQYHIWPVVNVWSPVTGYFPDFYPTLRAAYGQTSPTMRSVIQNGMSILKNNQ